MLTCQRFKSAPALEHPANAIPINHHFERIPYISKRLFKNVSNCGVHVKNDKNLPIENNSRSSSKNLAIISQFGPPEEILSDCGTEFLNETVSALLNVAGIERRVTSPFMPRVDGLCERANQTVANVFKEKC